MSIFIKAGLWIEKKLGYKGELNLTKYVEDLIASTPGGVTSVNTLTGAVSLTTENIPEATDKNYVTDAELVLINTQVVNETDYLDVINGYTVAGQNYTFLADWTWVIDGVTGYTNPGNVVINFPLTSPTFSRIDAVVVNTSNTFVRIAGTPSTTTPASPAIPSDTVFVLFVTVDDVSVTVTPGPPGRNQVSNQPYNATTWNGVNTIAPSKNAVRDKFESFSTSFIPLTGTTVGNPVSGDIETTSFSALVSSQGNMGVGVEDNKNLDDFQDGSMTFYKKAILYNFTKLTARKNDVIASITPFVYSDGVHQINVEAGPDSKGLVGATDFSPNITDLDYTQKIYVDSLARPYKVYTALLTQSGTSVPTVTILENTLGSIIWTYAAVGLYKATLTGGFIYNKTVLFTSSLQNGSPVHIAFTYENSNEVYLASFDSLGAPTNDLVINSSVEIRVYN